VFSWAGKDSGLFYSGRSPDSGPAIIYLPNQPPMPIAIIFWPGGNKTLSAIVYLRVSYSCLSYRENPMKKFLLISALLFTTAGCAVASDMPATKSGDILVNKTGMTLYTFDKDSANSGKSVCNGECAEYWPPLMATSSAAGNGKFSVVTRDDGSKQWAYEGKPLYTFKADKKAGDRNGDNKKNVWHVVKD
jgi:predicted lipoprotein with Yx(FWY)xxD motif